MRGARLLKFLTNYRKRFFRLSGGLENDEINFTYGVPSSVPSHVIWNLMTRNARTMRCVIGRTIRTHLVGAYLLIFGTIYSISRMYLNIALIARRTNFKMRSDFHVSSRVHTRRRIYNVLSFV